MTREHISCLLIGALPGSLVNFRGPLIRALLAKGLKVYATANGPDAETESQLRALGVEYCPIQIARAGMNPLADVITLIDLIRLMQRVKPDVVLSYTIKPVIYGGLAARICGVASIYSLVTGLGYAFMDAATARQQMAKRLAKFLYHLSLRYSRRVFFQNPDDCLAFIEMGLITQDRAVVVNGSGVDLELFPFMETALTVCADATRDGVASTGNGVNRFVRFLLIARLLRDKGLGEYAAAAKIVKQKHPCAEFHLIGYFEPNPADVKPEEVQEWQEDGLIRFHGEQSDVRPFLRDCDVYVLPSYREGTPRTVLEAMATGRAIITTDAPGCRETVCFKDEGEGNEPLAKTNGRIPGKLKMGKNGILTPVKDAEALAEAMEFFLKHPEQIAIMGRESRHYAEERYDVHKVNAVIMQEMGLGK
jgi:glycosyltransferase involved in cell wall biosynthesis